MPRLWLVILVLLLGASARGGEVRPLMPLDGKGFGAELLSIGADGQLALKANGKNVTRPASQIAWWGALPAMSGGTVLLLADGGQLAGEIVAGPPEAITIDSPILGKVQVPRAAAKGVLVGAPSDYAARDRLAARALSAAETNDWLLLDNGDELIGKIQKLDDKQLLLESQVGPTPIELSRVAAMAFSPIARGASTNEPRWLVGFADGTWLVASKLASTPGQAAEMVFESPAGWKAQTLTEDIAWLQPLASANYLSDRAPVGYKHIPFLKTEWPYGTDRNAAGGLLRHGEQVFPKGIGMHSTSRLTYDLAPDEKRFAAEIALDASAGTRGSVVFRVFVDNEQRYASPIVRGGDPPTPISVDVQGGRRLSLIVDFADRGDELDRADWLNARLTR